MKNNSIVYLSQAAYNSLLVSAIEVFPRETDGVLVGNRGSDGNFKIEYAHPYQTSKRGFDWVEEGNSRAVRRVNNLLSALNGRPESSHIIGGYHSHPEPKGTKAKTSPSKSDLHSIRTEFLPEYPALGSWLELITKVRCPLADRAKKTGPTHFRRLKKLATTARYDGWHAYNFLTGAFLISPKEKNGYDELRIEVLGQQ